MDDRMIELIAVGASAVANCCPCLEFHVDKAMQLGIDRTEIAKAVEVAKLIRKGAASSVDKLAWNMIQKKLAVASADKDACNCC